MFVWPRLSVLPCIPFFVLRVSSFYWACLLLTTLLALTSFVCSCPCMLLGDASSPPALRAGGLACIPVWRITSWFLVRVFGRLCIEWCPSTLILICKEDGLVWYWVSPLWLTEALILLSLRLSFCYPFCSLFLVVPLSLWPCWHMCSASHHADIIFCCHHISNAASSILSHSKNVSF